MLEKSTQNRSPAYGERFLYAHDAAPETALPAMDTHATTTDLLAVLTPAEYQKLGQWILDHRDEVELWQFAPEQGRRLRWFRWMVRTGRVRPAAPVTVDLSKPWVRDALDVATTQVGLGRRLTS